MICSSCSAVNAEGARFCSSCGHTLINRSDERRVVTVVFADLVGFTSLSESRDPEQVKNLVDSCFERLVHDVGTFGGKVDKIVGDAIIALFGAPVAHEDDAERAVRSALRMQETLGAYCDETGAEVALRVGVNTGEVLVGALRAGGEYTAMGDVVNTAERLEASARPGAVVVGSATHAATRDVIDYHALGSLLAKGRDEPVEVWEAVAPLLPPGYRPRRVQTPFVGREAELGMLTHAVDAAVAHDRAQLLLLVGEAGVGKSRLAEEVAERARREHRAFVFEGRCVPYGEANVWWPVAEALRHACGVTTDDPLRIAAELCAEAVALSLDLSPTSVEVTRIVSGLLYLMGYEGRLRQIDPQRAREEATRSVLAFLEGSTRKRPVVVVLSDLHWADDLVLELLDVLIERLGRRRLVVVATARQTLGERWALQGGRHNLVVVNLDPLARDATGLLLDALLESDLPDDLRSALLDRSGGNPFFLEELVALLAEAEVSPEAPTRTGAFAELPDTLRGLVAARIDALTPEERDVVADAAVWGRSGPLEALERTAEQIRAQLDITVEVGGLVDKEILLVDGRHWSFRSDLIREVAYGTLTKADRARRHCGIAWYLERAVASRAEANERAVDVIAHHYAATAELIDELGPIDGIPDDVTDRALDWLEEAARRADVAQVLPVAARLFDQAVSLLERSVPAGTDPAGTLDGPRMLRLLLGRARARGGLWRFPEARADLSAARALAVGLGDPVGEAQSRLAEGECQQREGDLAGAVVTLGDAVDRFRAAGDQRGMAEALRLRGMTQIFKGENPAAEASITEALDISRELDDRRGEAWALQNLAWISYIEGRATEAEARLEASAATFTEIGDSGGLSWANGLLAFVTFHQGRSDEALALSEQVLVEARERGDRWGEGMMLLLTASIRLWSGRSLEAVTVADEGVAEFVTLHDRLGASQCRAVLGRGLVASGQVREGMETLQEALADGEAVGSVEMHSTVAAALAGSAVQIGAPEIALESLAAVADLHEGKPSLGDTDRRVAEAIALVQVGRAQDALGLLDPLVASDSDDPTGCSAYAVSAWCLALAAAGRGTEADDALARLEHDLRPTYLDVGVARVAAALAAAARRDEHAAAALSSAVDQVDATDDRVARAVFRLAEALGLEALGLPSSAEAANFTEYLLAELGIDAGGWRTAFGLILSGSAEASLAGRA